MRRGVLLVLLVFVLAAHNIAVSGMTSSGTVIASIPAGAVHNALGNSGTASARMDNKVTYNTSENTPSSAKLLPDGADAGLVQGVVSMLPSDGISFYIESEDDCAGILVTIPSGRPCLGRLVAVTGTMRTNSDYERYIEADSVSDLGAGSVNPVFIRSGDLGGRDRQYNQATGKGQSGVTGSRGLNNIGLLATVMGKFIEQIDSTHFTIDDGSGPVLCETTGGINPNWDYLLLKGASSCHLTTAPAGKAGLEGNPLADHGFDEFTFNETPIVSRGATGAYDDFTVGDAQVVRNGSEYVMFYGSQPTGPWPQFAAACYATSPDGISWRKAGQSEPPHLAGSEPNTYPINAMRPVVFQIGSTWYMLYDLNRKAFFTRYSSSLLSGWCGWLGGGYYTALSVGSFNEMMSPEPYIEDGTLYLYHTKMTTENTWRVYCAGMSAAQFAALCTPEHYTELPGAWTDHGLMLDRSETIGNWDYGWVAGGHVTKLDDGMYVMVYNGGNSRAGGEAYPSGIGLAYAATPLGPWTKSSHNPMIASDASRSQAKYMFHGRLYCIDDEWRIYFNAGTCRSGGFESIFYATAVRFGGGELHPMLKVDSISIGRGSSIVGRTLQVGGGDPSSEEVESPHPYPDDYSNSWTVTEPDAQAIRVGFDSIELESGDVLLIKSPDGVIWQTYTTGSCSGWSKWVLGNTLVLQLISDSSDTAYGFRMVQKQGSASMIPQANTQMDILPGPFSLNADPSGVYCFDGLRAGIYSVTPSQPGTWSPESREVTIGTGETASNIDFIAN